MSNKLTKAALTATFLVLGQAAAHATQAIDLIPGSVLTISSNGPGTTPIIVTSSNGTSWTDIKTSDLAFPTKVQLDVPNGQPAYYRIYQGAHEAYYAQMLNYSEYNPTPPLQIDDWPLYETTPVAMGSTLHLSPSDKQTILERCNGKGRPDKTYSFGFGIELRLSATFWLDGAQTLTDQERTANVAMPVICKRQLTTSNDIAVAKPDFKVKDIDLFLTTFSGATSQPDPATVCKKAQVKVRLKTTKAGPAKFKLWTKIGSAPLSSKTVDAWASHDGNGGFEAEHTEWVSVNKTSQVQAMAEDLVNAIGQTTQWKEITLHCTSPGGGGIATNPSPGDQNPDDIPQLKNVEGDFSFFDPGKARCTRTGKALLTFTSPKPDNIHFSLDCKDDNHSGVVPVVPNPAGGYMAAKIVSFDVNKTYTEACTLRTVAPYGPKEHVSKTHLFQCSTPVGHTASDDVQVPSIPPWDRPVDPTPSVQIAPQRVITGTGVSANPSLWWQCIGGSMKSTGCVCRAGWKAVPWTVKDHGVKRHGKKCVPSGPGNKTTVPSDPSLTGLTVNPQRDAERRRLEAAKKAEEARRKREQAAERARKLKAARDAVIAKRKRDAALAKRKRDAELARARLKAKQKAALKAQQRARRTNAAINTFSAPKRKKVRRKKRSAPKLTGNAVQMRAIRRR